MQRCRRGYYLTFFCILSSLLSVSCFRRSNIATPTSRKANTLNKSCNIKQNSVTRISASPLDTPPNTLVLRSPCKINLFLRILSRRADGFHDLSSLFQAVSLFDYLHFQPIQDPSAKQDVLSCSITDLEIDQSNLVIKALDLMRRKTNIPQYFQVFLDKKAPMQAGLGGGSGNAATAMFAFNQLTNARVKDTELVQWSAEIGSDISFFFSHGTAYCTGRGEHVQDLAPLPDAKLVKVLIIKPKGGLSTASVFKALDLSKLSAKSPEDLLESFVKKGVIASAKGRCLVNDLESPAFLTMPRLANIKEQLYYLLGERGTIMMSGSGSSIIAVAESFSPNLLLGLSNILGDCSLFEVELINRQEGGWY